mmetsp:Transcript_11047/g.37600  ORF Transcript_11047/g.37600 Transcript_11047/m.37600 type:complete len:253 (-) Transcript_11047:193-951(-)
MNSIICFWKVELPWEESITITLTPCSTRRLTRSLSDSRVWMDAPTRSRLLLLSLEACGKSRFLRRSLREMSDTSSCRLFTMGSFPFLESRRMELASSSEQPSSATITSVVITSDTRVSRSTMKSWSREVTIPTRRLPILPDSVTGKPEKPNLALISSMSLSLCCGDTVNGSVMKPFLKRFTWRTISHCSSMVLLQWTMPMPPKRAMWIAIWASVTVSMGLDTKGVFRVIFLVSLVERSTASAPKEMKPGRMM